MVRLARSTMWENATLKRLRIVVRGAVQGVGFRPFVYRLASTEGLAGWIRNSPQGAVIEVEGSEESLQRFLLLIEREAPPLASIQSLEFSFLDRVHIEGFEIRASEDCGAAEVIVLPDVATCAQCIEEIFDPRDRRFRYPFTNCTQCGPRYSIIEALPYDRACTSMRSFRLCDACSREYEDVSDRRFHAQPLACAECGPHLQLWDGRGACIATHDDALREAARALGDGAVVAVKGLGGFHLMADANDAAVVRRLRERKHREEKPFAVMLPSLELARSECEVGPLEERLLRSRECPIVLLRRRTTGAIAPEVAPGNRYLGVLLPYTPLHHLLMREIGTPIVATSGNISEEPICIDEHEALGRLRGIADLFLVHNRPIVRHVDDSVVRVQLGRELVLRRARGYAPLPQHVSELPVTPVLAVGPQLKNTVAVAVGESVFLSQHIGDLENRESTEAFQRVMGSLQQLYRAKPVCVAADMHPGYVSTQFALKTGLPLVSVQHHFAHVVSCMAENDLRGEVLGVSWDGTGYGPDKTIWGGEFLVTDGADFRRAASFRRFRLPGAASAVREPRRSAIGALHEIFGDALSDGRTLAPMQAFSARELAVLRTMLRRGLNSPWTTSAGRLFDAVASILGLRQRSSFEGQAALDLEMAVDENVTGSPLACALRDSPGRTKASATPQFQPDIVVDWEPLLRGVVENFGAGCTRATIAAQFHHALASAIVEVARRVGKQCVVLTGGCFQNRYLNEITIRKLEASGFRPYWHQRIPPNDGGVALGQAVVASRASKRRK